MALSDETLTWTNCTAFDTGAQIVILRADGQARVILPYQVVAGRRSYLLQGLGERQPVLQARGSGQWSVVEPLPAGVFAAWRRWCAGHRVIPRVEVTITAYLPDPHCCAGVAEHYAALIAPYQHGDAVEVLLDPDEDRQSVLAQLQRAAQARGLAVRVIERPDERVILRFTHGGESARLRPA